MIPHYDTKAITIINQLTPKTQFQQTQISAQNSEQLRPNSPPIQSYQSATSSDPNFKIEGTSTSHQDEKCATSPAHNVAYPQGMRIQPTISIPPYAYYSPPLVQSQLSQGIITAQQAQTQHLNQQDKPKMNVIQNFNGVTIPSMISSANTNKISTGMMVSPQVTTVTQNAQIGLPILPPPSNSNLQLMAMNALNSQALTNQFANRNSMIIQPNQLNSSKPILDSIHRSAHLDSTGLKINPNLTIARRLPAPDIIIPRETEMEMNNSHPYFYKDKTGGFRIRCVCGKNPTNGHLLQCDHCEHWLHGICVNIARSKPEPYFCPFCTCQRINCICKKNMLYSLPIIRCSRCGKWYHKECQDIGFGVVPDEFVCTVCNNDNEVFYDFPFVCFDPSFPDHNIVVDASQASKLLELIPDGNLKNEVILDLNNTELSFKDMLEKYYQKFSSLFFDVPHEFWKVFVNIFCILFTVDKQNVLKAIDHLTTNFLYADYYPVLTDVKFGCSNSIKDLLEKQANMTRFERLPEDIQLYYDENDDCVKTPTAIDDGGYIMDLPGFVLHPNEVNAEKGIPKSLIVVTNSDELVVDMNGTPLINIITKIRRSFHFNAIVKLIRVNGFIKVALFGKRTQGPLSDNKNKRGPAINEGCEIVLPFDGYIPFNVKKIEWKERVKHIPVISKPVSQRRSIEDTAIADDDLEEKSYEKDSAERLQNEESIASRRTPRNKDKKKQKGKKANRNNIHEISKPYDINFTLLSSFMSDFVPPLPIKLMPNQNALDKYNMLQMVKSQSRHASSTS